MATSTLLLVLTASKLLTHTSAVGIGNVDTTNTVGFVQEDNQRNTISLLLSCLATLGLCVYSAVHLNVPRRGERYYQTLLRELLWCVIGLFAPELILYTAWRQLASARQLRYEVEHARGESGSETSSSEKIAIAASESRISDKRRAPWTIAHGFYGSMGGFAIDLDDADGRYARVFGDAKHLILTAKGVALLANCGHIPDISLDDIRDKNKADGLAKLLVCVQAGWMIVQVVTRTATGLPTSLLEVHTVAHVVCALIMYVLWWHKPRQVTSPTLLKPEGLWPLATYMFLASRMSGEMPKGKLSRFRFSTPRLKQLAYFEHGRPNEVTDMYISRLTTSDTIVTGHFGPPPSNSDLDRIPSSPLPEDAISAEQMNLAVEAVALYPALRARFTSINHPSYVTDHISIYRPYATELVQPHALDWPNAGVLRRTQSLVMGMVLWGASMAYGAIHVAAWSYFFPSYIEKLLWRFSSVWATFCAGFWLVTNLLAHLFPGIDRVWVAYNERRLGWVWVVVINALCVMCGVSFLASRAYLVVEAFVSIREVPADVYLAPAWAQVFPHL
ncbi:hypothetical protein CC86DRAFT_350141 [Ophiobolus disseminans]|uniref:Uncharacterized protein n=1 Tax=Ophiobolus disseminans TaxID=1469910 RepID=A0A6A7A2C0_9PLEO|nr:hypothetical protein CC86DRAFT_350141 [Ophiobolus disseminans]